MKLKYVLLGCGLVFFPMAYAEKLTQQQYDDIMETYTDQVNRSKKILDHPAGQADAVRKDAVHTDSETQKQAFCSRMQAYHQIAAISQQNAELDTAQMMLMIAQNYLEKQNQRLNDSGMTEQVFCAGLKPES
ncbi:hypothetical protein [Acinetobacter sp. WZC-1]|uniref:hypothetical protein n=1 Tax=Acinetobacter sp. WZC-1 TaxID=3459034 RepID=UPI00403D7487